MPYVNRRWLGGLLTNFNTIRKRIQRLHELRELQEAGRLDLLPTKERMSMEAELRKLEYNLGGVADMQRLPDAVIIIDLKTEEIALREAERLEIPIIGLVDTNCDPTPVDYVIPGNDDAIRSCELIMGTLGAAIEGAAAKWREEEARRRAEEEERKRREEEERKRREAEEKARAGGGGEGATGGRAGGGRQGGRVPARGCGRGTSATARRRGRPRSTGGPGRGEPGGGGGGAATAGEGAGTRAGEERG